MYWRAERHTVSYKIAFNGCNFDLGQNGCIFFVTGSVKLGPEWRVTLNRSGTMENKKVSHRPIPSYRGRCFTVRFGRDGAAVESGVKCTGEIGKTGFFVFTPKQYFLAATKV